MQAVLVTGGAGYIGSHACKALRAAGFLPVSLDNLGQGHAAAVKWGPLVKGDLRDRNLLDQLFATHRPVAVLHFAAFASVAESVAAPERYYSNNVGGTIALLDAMRSHGGVPIVFSSTCATYGVPQSVPIGEDHVQRPVNPYGWSKLMVEQMLRDHEAAFGDRHVSLRYFNAAGADPEGETGEDHDPETHLIPLVIEASLGRRSRIEIYGTDYPTADGTAIRDYVHVTDLASVHVLALRYLLDGSPSASVNVGTGVGHSVREVIGAVERACGKPVSKRESERRPGDPPVLVAGARRATALFGWRPRLSGLDEIVDTALRWHRSHAPGRAREVARAAG
jgi:UDP-arabinose 4-epimerase